MQYRPSIIERAYQLADEGILLRYIRFELTHEGYDIRQLFGTALLLDLNRRIRAARIAKSFLRAPAVDRRVPKL